MLNSIHCMGRLVADPELRQTASGVDYCTFTIACDRDFKQGDEKVADFFNVTAWRHTAKFIGNNFSKGRMIVVSGRLQTRKYQDKNGNNRVATEIHAENVYFADSKKADSAAAQTPQDFPELPDDGPLPF